LSREQVKRANIEHFFYLTGEYEYTTNDGVFHLIRDGFDLVASKKATSGGVFGLKTDAYYYRTQDRYVHLIIDGIDVLKDKKANSCSLHLTGINPITFGYSYISIRKKYFFSIGEPVCHFIYNDKDYLEDKEAVDFQKKYVSVIGCFEYKTKDGIWYDLKFSD
jgi:hypothetical protein